MSLCTKSMKISEMDFTYQDFNSLMKTEEIKPWEYEAMKREQRRNAA